MWLDRARSLHLVLMMTYYPAVQGIPAIFWQKQRLEQSGKQLPEQLVTDR